MRLLSKAIRRATTEKGNKVRFRLADVFLPNVEELRAGFHLDEELEGTVIDFSDSGIAQNAFAILEVVRQVSVVIPVGKLKVARSSEASEDDDSRGQ